MSIDLDFEEFGTKKAIPVTRVPKLAKVNKNKPKTPLTESEAVLTLQSLSYSNLYFQTTIEDCTPHEFCDWIISVSPWLFGDLMPDECKTYKIRKRLFNELVKNSLHSLLPSTPKLTEDKKLSRTQRKKYILN